MSKGLLSQTNCGICILTSTKCDSRLFDTGANSCLQAMLESPHVQDNEKARLLVLSDLAEYYLHIEPEASDQVLSSLPPLPELESIDVDDLENNAGSLVTGRARADANDSSIQGQLTPWLPKKPLPQNRCDAITPLRTESWTIVNVCKRIDILSWMRGVACEMIFSCLIFFEKRKKKLFNAEIPQTFSS